MGSLLKILKALNSSQYPWQISLAVVFGMFVGLLPFFNFWTMFFIFLAFVININFGIFFLSASLFAVVGLFLDPVLHTIGKAILTADFLVPMWTAIYNIPFTRITDFNNTIVMGALAVSTVLSVPVYIAVKKAVLKYREKFAVLVNKYPILKALKLVSTYEKVAGD